MKNQLVSTVRRSRIVPAVACLALASGTLIACQVPVFRFALERWAADQYEIVILHDHALEASEIAAVKELRSSDHLSDASANFRVATVDVSKTDDSRLKEVWRRSGGQGDPLMVTLYPRNAQEVPDRVASVLPLGAEAIEHVADSPVRQELVKKLIDGDSAVWIFVPCGDEAQDSVARKMLVEQVKLNEQQLQLPPQEEIEADEFFNESSNIELRLSFSIVTLRRDDPKEQYLLSLLLESEPDLLELNQPMAFPVLGRGRVLYALVGKGIFEDTIAMASSFIVGPCSCQVKEQNPGFDLLLAVDWDEKVGVKAAADGASPAPTEPVLLTIPPGRKSKNK